MGEVKRRPHQFIYNTNHLAHFIGGETGIRTLGGVTPTTVFETAPFDHSGISPSSEHRYAPSTAATRGKCRRGSEAPPPEWFANWDRFAPRSGGPAHGRKREKPEDIVMKPQQADRPGHGWHYDLSQDRTHDGRACGILTSKPTSPPLVRGEWRASRSRRRRG